MSKNNKYYKKNLPNCVNFTLDMIYDNKHLNLFSDASMKGKNGGCYGSVLVQGDTIIDEVYKFSSNCTVVAAELRGIRLSLDMALKYRYMAPIINIFSDSQISIFTLRDYFYTWLYNYSDNTYYTKTSVLQSEPAKNQNLVIECIAMINELRKTNMVNLYHQKGHVTNKLDSLEYALETFKKSNNIYGKVDFNLIRYISTYNNFVDNKTRSILNNTDIVNFQYRDAVSFHPIGNTSLIY